MKREKQNGGSKIGREILGTMLIISTALTVTIALISIFVNLRTEERRLDQNLQNIAQAVAHSSATYDEALLVPYLDSFKSALSNIDVISVVGAGGERLYHTTHSLIGSKYDGTLPDFSSGELLVTDDTGPSGSQRRAYAAIYGSDGSYRGFVMAVMLKENINKMILRTVLIHLVAAALVLLPTLGLAAKLSLRIKKKLNGYEPDVFGAMFTVRENILEALEEGIVAFDGNCQTIYLSSSAAEMLGGGITPEMTKLAGEVIGDGQKRGGINLRGQNGSELIADLLPVGDGEHPEGALCILRDRTEFTKLMEDLSGIRYMVESMRANSHDFINKLHVILGLVRMGECDRAVEYIMGVTSIQQTVINSIAKNIEDPSVAALLIGKYARASELNIRFKLVQGSHLSRADIYIPSGDLVTIIGDLTDNALDAINAQRDGSAPRELTVGIFTTPHALLINVDDTGGGIAPEIRDDIFGDGVTTKGEGHGKGLYIVRGLVNRHGGRISVESEPGVGTSFTVTMTDDGGVTDTSVREERE